MREVGIWKMLKGDMNMMSRIEKGERVEEWEGEPNERPFGILFDSNQ